MTKLQTKLSWLIFYGSQCTITFTEKTQLELVIEIILVIVIVIVNYPTLSMTLAYCGQTVGWIRMPLGMEIGLGPWYIVLD